MNSVGQRYVCEKCGAEYVVTRPGNGELSCCGQPMKPKDQRKDRKSSTEG